MTAHFVGQVLLAVMFTVSCWMLIADLGGNWRRIWTALRGRAGEPARPRRPILESTKSTVTANANQADPA